MSLSLFFHMEKDYRWTKTRFMVIGELKKWKCGIRTLLMLKSQDIFISTMMMMEENFNLDMYMGIWIVGSQLKMGRTL